MLAITGSLTSFTHNPGTTPPGIGKSKVEAASKNVELADKEIWRRFIDEYNVLIDYADSMGNFPRPTSEEYKLNKPNALAGCVPH